MRRIRQDFPGLPATGGRLAFAIAFSAALHILLIGNLALRPTGTAVPRPILIHALLMPAEFAPVQVRHERVPILRPVAVDTTVPLPEAASPAASTNTPSSAQPLAGDARLAISGLPEPPDLVHYAAKDLDVYPHLQGALHPDYPEPARAQKIPGTVILLVLIDEAGRVTETSVVDAEPEGLFEDSAQQAFSNVVFTPAQRDGRRVRSRILVSVNYDPDKP